MKINRRDVSQIIMSVNPPQVIIDSYYKVIFHGSIMKWDGFVWIELGDALQEDYRNYPEVR